MDEPLLEILTKVKESFMIVLLACLPTSLWFMGNNQVNNKMGIGNIRMLYFWYLLQNVISVEYIYIYDYAL